MAKEGYSLEVVCRPFQLCEFSLYVPDPNASREPGDYVTVDEPRWQPGFGAPVARMRGLSTQLPQEEAALAGAMPKSDIYTSHRLYSRHAGTGDEAVAVAAANSFLEGHQLIGEIQVDPKRIGELAFLGTGAEGESELFIPSPALATAMGQLPMGVEATLES